MVYYFLFITLKNIFKPCFFILKTFCGTLNWWIGGFVFWCHEQVIREEINSNNNYVLKDEVQKPKLYDKMDIENKSKAHTYKEHYLKQSTVTNNVVFFISWTAVIVWTIFLKHSLGILWRSSFDRTKKWR